MGSKSEDGSECKKKENGNKRKRMCESENEKQKKEEGQHGIELGIGCEEKNQGKNLFCCNGNGDSKEDAEAEGDGSLREIGEVSAVDIVGLEFSTLEECCEFYNTYAKWHGFVVRKHMKKEDRNGNIFMRDLVCNRQGLRDEKHKKRINRVRASRDETRTNCRAMIRFRYQRKCLRWRVVKFYEAHNHPLTAPEQVHLHPKYRFMSEADKAQAAAMHAQGIRTCQIMGYIVDQKGGHGVAGFVKKDMYNFIGELRRGKTVGGDADAAISFFKAKFKNDPLHYTMYTEKDGRLQNLFWTDNVSRTDYKCFGDVLAFDSTYNTNKYERPLVVMSGYNNHGKTCVFGCALLEDEKTETYKWVLTVFLEAMYGKQPVAVVTDGDCAMKDAIKEVFPNAWHRLCSWHLNRNAKANVKNPVFLTEFNRALYANLTVDEFEVYWQDMVARHELGYNPWVKRAYSSRKSWAAAYMRDKFFGGIRTTSICEGVNSFISKYVKSRDNVIEFVVNFERAVKEYRHNELMAEFKTMSSEPVLDTSLEEFEEDAAKIYTRDLFVEVKAEIVKAGSCQVKYEIDSDGIVIMKVEKFGKADAFTDVKYHINASKFQCDCRLFESRGIPCCHIFCAMREKHIPRIPSSLILKRWTKFAKADCIASMPKDDGDNERGGMFRFAALSAECNTLCKVASKNSADFLDVQRVIAKLTEEVAKRVEKRKNKTAEKSIGDPCIVKTKGAPPKRTHIRKKKKCSKCRKSGHDIRTCPKLQSQLDVEGDDKENGSGRSDSDGREDSDDDEMDVGEVHHIGVQMGAAKAVEKVNAKKENEGPGVGNLHGEIGHNVVTNATRVGHGGPDVQMWNIDNIAKGGLWSMQNGEQGKDIFAMGLSAMELLKGVQDPNWPKRN